MELPCDCMEFMLEFGISLHLGVAFGGIIINIHFCAALYGKSHYLSRVFDIHSLRYPLNYCGFYSN